MSAGRSPVCPLSFVRVPPVAQTTARLRHPERSRPQRGEVERPLLVLLPTKTGPSTKAHVNAPTRDDGDVDQFSPYRRLTLSCTIFFCTDGEKLARFFAS